MSTAIIKYKDNDDPKFYCKSDSCPAILGFELLAVSELKEPSYLGWIMSQGTRIMQVYEIPKDIQYEYVIDTETNTIDCQECWYTPDVGYHGGGFRHGGRYDLKDWRRRLKLQKENTYRNEEAFEADRRRREKENKK